MRHPTFKTALRGGLALSFGLAAACGGGGGGGGGESVPEELLPVDLVVTPAALARQAEVSQAYVAPLTFSLAVSQVPADGLHVVLDRTSNGAIQFAEFESVTATTGSISVLLRTPTEPGTYSDTLTVHVCYDSFCNDEVTNSPATLAVQYRVVEGPADFVADPLPISGQAPVGHNVLDAEYSPALDAVLMVATTPANALHVHFPESGESKSVVLGSEPRSISLSPDGLTAAIPHGSLITLVDLDRLDDPLVDPTTVLDVSIPAYESVVPGNGYVYALPVSGYHTGYPRVIEIATGAETVVGTYGFADSMRARVHPAADRIYGLTSGSPSDVHRISVTGGASITHYDSPYHGDYANCRDLWLHETGERVFTACSNLYRTSNVKVHDMVYAGSLELVPERFPDWYRAEIKSLSHTAEGNEIVLLEESNYECVNTTANCRTRLSLYDGAHYNLLGRYTIPRLDVDGTSHRQRGAYAFHSADGTKRYLVTRLEGMADPTREYWLGAANVTGNVPASVTAPQLTPTLRPTIEPFPAAPQADFEALPHDVVDAEFSAVLNAVVMVSQHPSSALHVYDLASGTEFSIPLPRPPLSVSVSPDGLHAAVGHDGLVTQLTLSEVLPLVTLLDASLEAKDVALAGNDWVYALGTNERLLDLHSIQVATNEETLSGGASGSLLAHPDGMRLYTARSASIGRSSTSDGVAKGVMGISFGDESVCSKAWFDESADRLYTACGRVIALAENPDFDLTLLGILARLVDPLEGRWLVHSVSQSDERNEIAMIENHPTRCAGLRNKPCLSHLNFYVSDTLTLTQRYALAPVMLGDETYPQRGMFVFHAANGAEIYVISRLDVPKPWAGYYVSRIAIAVPGV